MRSVILRADWLWTGLALTAALCAVLPSDALADPDDPPEEAQAADDPDDAPDTLDSGLPPSLADAPEVVLEAVDVVFENADDPAAAASAVEDFITSLPPDRAAEMDDYFEAKVQERIAQIEATYDEIAAVDPVAAESYYEEAMGEVQGYDDTAPSVPEAPPPNEAPPPAVPGVEDTGDPADGAPSLSPDMTEPGGSTGFLWPFPAGVSGPRDGADGSGKGWTFPGLFGVQTMAGWTHCTTVPWQHRGRFERCNGELAHVYIHGRQPGPAGPGYWSPGAFGPSSHPNNIYYIRWDGQQSIQNQAPVVREALNLLCNVNRPCVLFTHSAGSLMAGFLLSQGGAWNIVRVNSIQGAEGGSEAANQAWMLTALGVSTNAGPWPIDILSLPVSTARSLYPHDVTSGVPFTNFSSEFAIELERCRWYEIGCKIRNIGRSAANAAMFSFFRGANDQLLGYHSTAGFRLPNDNHPATSTCVPGAPPTNAGRPFRTANERWALFWSNRWSFHWGSIASPTCGRGFLQIRHGQPDVMLGRVPR